MSAIPRRLPAQATPRTTLTTPAQLAAAGLVETDAVPALQRVAERFSVAVTPALTELIEAEGGDGPLTRQFVPDTRELDPHPDDQSDPIGDERHSPLPGIVHRYPDRLLLLPLRVCPVYCRFCFRRETVGRDSEALSPAELEAAFDYIAAHDEIWEVILSGGDPLALSPRRRRAILERLYAIPHDRVIRIHTRVPVAVPDRITSELAALLRLDKPVYVVLHSNHAHELTPDVEAACERLTDNGIPLLSQSVLLRGINDDAATLEALFRRLVELGVKPYYLHHADRAIGTAHFRTSIEEGREIMRQLRGRVSGLCLPEYVLDRPGGEGKVPVGDTWVAPEGDTWQARDARRRLHAYDDSEL